MRSLTAIPASRLDSARLNARVKLVWGLMIGASALGLISTVLWVVKAPAPTPPAPPVPWGAGVAEVAAGQFLTGAPLTVPLAADLPSGGESAGGGVTVRSLSLEQSRVRGLPTSNGTYTYEEDTFLADTSAGLLRVTVVVTRDGDKRVALAALPAMTPANGAIRVRPLDYGSLLPSGQVPSTVASRAQEWATAFAASGRNHPEADQKLREMAGRGDLPAGTRPGLNGAFTVASVQVIGQAVPVRSEAVTGIGVRVRLVLTPVSAQKSRLSADYDLLVTAVDQPLPLIAAYGPAGSLPELVDNYSKS